MIFSIKRTSKTSPVPHPFRALCGMGGSLTCALQTSFLTLALAASLGLALSGCKGKDQGDGAPPPAKVIQVADMNLVTIDPNDVAKFPITSAGQIESASELTATGSVFPDVSREIPVISLANGRVVDIKARLDDNVQKGQLLLKVQSPDITSAFDTTPATSPIGSVQNIQHTLIIVYACNIDGLRNILTDFFQCLRKSIRDIRVVDRCLELGSRIIL